MDRNETKTEQAQPEKREANDAQSLLHNQAIDLFEAPTNARASLLSNQTKMDSTGTTKHLSDDSKNLLNIDKESQRIVDLLDLTKHHDGDLPQVVNVENSAKALKDDLLKLSGNTEPSNKLLTEIEHKLPSGMLNPYLSLNQWNYTKGTWDSVVFQNELGTFDVRNENNRFNFDNGGSFDVNHKVDDTPLNIGQESQRIADFLDLTKHPEGDVHERKFSTVLQTDLDKIAGNTDQANQLLTEIQHKLLDGPDKPYLTLEDWNKKSGTWDTVSLHLKGEMPVLRNEENKQIEFSFDPNHKLAP